MLELTKQGPVWVLSSDLPINTDSIAELNECIEPCFSGPSPRCIVNLLHVPLIDSAGLEWLWEMRHRCDSCGGSMEIAAPTTLCREILQATRMTDHFIIFEDVVTAAGSFAR